ncbi:MULTISPECIES: metal ABC transporter substrate-binding protein [unclassified Guyparkeria]|uniref:metal ABC transporter substrate-binding protein n=1 Tax=unclassified Guyparkeria TaxID=2626246 RepID=UPI0007338276|nr:MULTISPECIES: metal ABC transporter substrate-binding protein [unclassified Guyparkeria]KTG16817.1 ABC transporter substrate-binding protein [Guyparkeria sp. XI15]OAE85851.1 ABC transporter substrate-binding protein [Guyparkeria sp. WRN-7]
MLKRLLILLAALLPATGYAADLRVVATTYTMGAMASAVGGERIDLAVLAPPDRDAHFLQAKPSMMRDLRRADLVVAVGAELEAGWLPAAVKRAANPAIQPGQPGYFEAAGHVDLLDVGGTGTGHVHDTGNPHFNLDPRAMQALLPALAQRLGKLDPAGAADYQANATQAITRIEARLSDWQARTADAPGAVFHHADTRYLMDWLDLPTLGYLEPVPGVPPTARHIQELAESLEGRDGVIIHAPYYPERGPRKLAEALGWPVEQHYTEPQAPTLTAWIEMIDGWVDALAAGQ